MQLLSIPAFFATLITGTQLLLPLYMEPTGNVLSPVYSAIEQNPSVQFVFIVSVNGGRTSRPERSSAWGTALGQLARYPNVRTLGHVPTSNGARDMSSIQEDISRYAGWGAGLAPQGIFFDEVSPRNEQDRLDFMSRAADYSRSRITDSMVLFNMGARPEATSYYDLCDGIVFQEAYPQYNGQQSIDALVPSGFADRSGILINNFSGNKAALSSVMQNLMSNKIQNAFITSSDNYNNLGYLSDIAAAARLLATS